MASTPASGIEADPKWHSITRKLTVTVVAVD